jgi:fructose-bisphosphate aldolase class II
MSGKILFDRVRDRNTIIMAVNTRVTAGVVRGIFRAAKFMDSAVIFELARSESNLKGGYTGLLPGDFAKNTMEAANDIGFDAWVLHADHITIKEGTLEELESTKKLIDNQIETGYTSFAIDASHLFDFKGGNLREELALNIDATTEIAKHIEAKMPNGDYGLEVEVGEIGKEGTDGRVLTKPEEAVTFISALNQNGVYPQVLAIANGSAHGNTYDALGNLVDQVSIDIPQTTAVAKALRDMNLNVRIAQHGITGTPRELISTKFPKGDIIKGNVGTFWQNLVFDIFKIYQPDLFKRMRTWVIETYQEKAPGLAQELIFGKFGKFAIKQFFDEIYSVDEDTIEAMESIAYAEALVFFKAFNSKGTARLAR